MQESKKTNERINIMTPAQENELVEYVKSLNRRIIKLEAQSKTQVEEFENIRKKVKMLDGISIKMQVMLKSLTTKMNFLKEKVSSIEMISRNKK